MAAFTSPVDIGNRAAQICGANRMDPVLGFNDTSSRVAAEISAVYDKLREAELQENDWSCAIKRTLIRAIDGNTMTLQPALWSPSIAYFVGSIVSDQSGNFWESMLPNNVNNDPLLSQYWQPYFGSGAVQIYDSTQTYYSGELVYTAVGDGTYFVYRSMIDGNSDSPVTATPWSATTTYFNDQVVTFNSVAYMSLVDLNLNQQPDTHPAQWTTIFVGGNGSINWFLVGGVGMPGGVALSKLNVIYPVTAGPAPDTRTRNAFQLPVGYLKLTQQNPKGTAAPLGGPSGYSYNDWNFENGYLVSSYTGPILLRFVADLTDVRLMHAMFCEGLACRIAIAVCQTLTQSSSQLQSIASQYQKFMGRAKIANAIEEGYDDPPDDDFITVRY